MSRILAYTSPGRGHLFPIVPVLDALRERGHEISLRTLASEVDAMNGRGFATAAMDPGIESLEHDDHQARNPRAAVLRSLDVFARRAPLDADDLRRAVEAERPDLLLVDINSWGAMAEAERWGGPWATWCPYPLPLPSRDAPPFGPGFAPARGPAGRLRDRVVGPLILRDYDRAVVPRINAIRAERGLPPVAGAADALTRAPLTLAMTAEPFEYRRGDWPASVRQIGPCAWEPPSEAPAWLDEVDRPLVLVTTSSEFQDDGKLVQVALEALAGEDVQVVATLPAQDPGGFRPPANARVERFVPHGPLLERAACAVTHGGMGATQKALARGVPVCAVPFGRDQLEVARRLEESGAGTRVPERRLTPERLREAVREAMGRKEGARRVADAFAAAGGGPAGADALEGLLRG